MRVNSALSMAYKDTKSGVSKNMFVYCEEYWNGFSIEDKSSLFAGNLLSAKYSINSFHAKEYCYAVMLSAGVVTPPMISALTEVQGCVAPEFHEDEYQWPFLFGGWLPDIRAGLDHSIEWYDGDLRATAGYWAARAKLPRQGKLDSTPHLSCGRKAGIRLLVEPEEVPDWVDLVPYLGSKRLLKRHYARSQVSPARVLDEYTRLGRIRQDLYNKVLKGEADRPPVLQGWIQRHPNTYWLDVMPYVATAPTFTCVDKPRLLGSKGDTSELMRLLMLQANGTVQFRTSRPVCSTFMDLAKVGVLEECNFPVVPLAKQGVSSQLLALAPKGFPDWFQRTRLCPIHLGEGDSILKATELWGYCPWASLRMAIMMLDYLKQVGRSLDFHNYIWISEVHRGISTQEPEGFEEPPPDPMAPLTAQDQMSSEILSAYIRDVLRDWYPDIDAQMAEIRKRIIPRANPENSDEVRRYVRDQLDLDPYTLLPETERGVGFNEDRSDCESSSEFFDPWAELGVE
jgi:hypothetical protein